MFAELCHYGFVKIALLYLPRSVSFWSLLIIKLVARAVPELLIMERQLRDKSNFLTDSRGKRMKFITIQMIEISTL